MSNDYSVETCRELVKVVADAQLLREYQPSRYDPGDRLEVEVTGVCPAHQAQAALTVERFVGGGFAGQVYRVQLDQLDVAGETIPGLEPGGTYAVKIIVPPSRFSLLFRNAIYWLAYQGPFSAQVNPAAARAGVLWQKLVRRAARIRFGSEAAVVDTYATFYDPNLHSFAEINEWVDGRNWNFEIDEHLFERRKWRKEDPPGSPEFVAKRRFLHEVVRLLHDVGAPELARQYEWWTAKSQPNALKRLTAGDEPAAGLTAIDFRAGLALLPFLPMSPADFRLIVKGIGRGQLVQFDRGNLTKLGEFVEQHAPEFDDLSPALDELHEAEEAYRASLPDLTHHHVRLLTSRALRDSVAAGLIQGWRVRGYVDDEHAEKLESSRFGVAVFLLAGFVPSLGRFLRRVWGNPEYRAHVWQCMMSWDYLGRYLRAREAEILIDWYRGKRVNQTRATSLLARPIRFWLQRFMLGWLPAKWHRFLAEPDFAWTAIKNTVSYPIRFYRDAEFREEWLTSEVAGGRAEGMLTDEEAEQILAKIKDPFIQKYLKCVAVHICTLPVTQVVSLLAAVYAMLRFGKTWRESIQWALAVLAFFQVTPISPGSIVRGTYVLYLMIRERDFRNYWLAALVSFWHYVGYLGFPLQMVQHYPSLSRFLAGRWATRVVHFIPVFGERGALLEHWVFDTFFNLPLTARRIWNRLPAVWQRAIGISCLVLFFVAIIALVWLIKMLRHGEPSADTALVLLRHWLA